MVTASVVLYKNSLEECRSLLLPLISSQVHTIYLVDHSPGSQLSVLSSLSEKIQYIKHENTGYGSGHNVAFDLVYRINPNGFHIVLNPDICITPDAIEKLSSFLTDNPDIGCCMPIVLNFDGTDQNLYKYLPTPFELLFKRFLPKFISKHIIKRLFVELTGRKRILSVPWLSGCFMFLRVEAIQSVHGFDERFFMYAEDIDFSRRIRQKYDTVLYPFVTIVHAHKAASYHSFRMLYIHICSIIKYFNKWGWFFDRERSVINKQTRIRNRLEA